MGVRIGFVVFVVCATGICFTQRDMYLHHEFKVLKCFSSQLSVSFDAYLFLHALFVWQIPAHWITGSTRDVIRNLRGVVWYLNTLEGIQHLGGFNFFLSRNYGRKFYCWSVSDTSKHVTILWLQRPFCPFSVSHLSWSAHKKFWHKLVMFFSCKICFLK